MPKSKNSSKRLKLSYDDIPDCWKKLDDIPSVEEMASRVQSDPIFADAFFLQETNNPENADAGTYEPLVDYQGHMFNEFDENFVTWVQAARGGAKSSSLARWVVGYCLRFPGTKVGVFAPAFRQSKRFYEYCVNYVNNNSKIEAHIYKLENELAAEPTFGQEPMMKFKNGSFIQPLPSGSGEKLRGLRFNIIIIDEAYQLQKEFHDSHIMPMGNVKIAGRRTKTFYLTTSWYTDVFAFSILQNILRQIVKGRKGYSFIDVTLPEILASGFPFDKGHVLHELETMSDPQTGKLSEEALMTFFNKWIKSGSSFYTAGMLTESQRADVPVIEKRPDKDETPTVIGVDPATVGEDNCQIAVAACPGRDERYLRAVYKWSKLRPEEIAGYIHKTVDLHSNTKLILMDKSGALGFQIAECCQKEDQLIDGIWQKRTPIYLWDHPDARNGRAHIILTRPSDERIKMAVMGRRYDETVTGEIDLKNTLHLNMKRVLQNNLFWAPKMLKDSDYYNSERGEIMDNIVEALAQFPKIDRKRSPDGKTLQTDARGNFYFTRPAKDDGAYSIIYANYCANIHYRLLEGPKRDEIPFMWGTDPEMQKMREESSHKIILPRL